MNRTINQKVGLAFGAIYIVVGLLGFTVTGGHDMAGHEGGLLLGIFGVNVLHNIVHLAVGVALIGAAMAGALASKSVNATVGAVYLLVGVVGMMVGSGSLNILALNGADHALHLGSAAVLLGVGLAADRRSPAHA
ncbi:DUF4383 domain-containing protein [Nocardioides limicola]|uniref:DUF4383 domain-containing protein n=1 Tax=Nocardioides limicola TaxID=2803368 RepID=UPI00193B0381|nr:DUF4383 domain-containing protein [Nocardioides sp. DJM-14]